MTKLKEGGFLISKIHQQAGRIFAKKLKKYKLDLINPAQGRILFALWQQDGISIQQLSHKTALEKSTLTSMLDRMEAAGLIKRELSKKDRRKVFIHLTDKNKQMEKAYNSVSSEMTRLFYKGFSEEKIIGFEENLRMILDNLMEHEQSIKKGGSGT
jgi:MarR family transcriptional regulator, organic hydroperoxide resistance regulator